MRKNQRSPYDYPKSRKYIIEDISAREKVNEELKSLQCSSVQEVQQTNQSYEMSWLEKLVNNMDDESKHSNSIHEQINRNFSRKSSTGNHASLVDNQKSIQSYSRPRSTFSGTKNENKNYQYTPYSKISQKYQQYGISSLKKDQNQRIPRDCFHSIQKYEANKKYVALEGPPLKKQQYRTHQIKEIDLNQSSQSYGRIKKVNKYKQQLVNKPLMQQIFISRPNNNKDHRKQRFITEQTNTRKSYNTENLQTQSANRLATYVNVSRKNEDFNAFRRRSSDYNILIQDNSYNNHKNVDFLTKLHMNAQSNENIERGRDQPRQKDLQKKHLREEDFKMDQMAKKLNVVLQNISKKSKLISQNNNQEKKAIEYAHQSQSMISLKDKGIQQRVFQKYDSDNCFHKQQKSKQTAKLHNRSSLISDKRKFISTEKQIDNERSWEKQKIKFINYHERQTKDNQKYSISYGNSYQTPDQRQLIRQKSKFSSKFPYSSEKSLQTQKYEQKTKYKSHLTPHQTQQKNKYQMMKKSLGMSKHIPQEIILQESSSQINSEISPRTEFLNRQFKAVFQNLDKNGIGELSRNNCDVESVNDEIKYLFGGILSRIKYKNERVSVKNFMQQCQNISKQFQFQQLKQVLNKQKKITNFKLNQKDTQSERWNNNTNYQSDSKRSSDRSEVVKKYQFIEDKKQMEKIMKISQKNNENRQKVHWAATQYADLAGRCQNFKISCQNEKYLIRRENIEQKESPLNGLPNKKQKIKKSQNEYEIDEKQNVKARPELGKDKKNFEKMCQNLNNKLNNYLTTIKQKEISGHHISLEFSELSKHMSSK